MINIFCVISVFSLAVLSWILRCNSHYSYLLNWPELKFIIQHASLAFFCFIFLICLLWNAFDNEPLSYLHAIWQRVPLISFCFRRLKCINYFVSIFKLIGRLSQTLEFYLVANLFGDNSIRHLHMNFDCLLCLIGRQKYNELRKLSYFLSHEFNVQYINFYTMQHTQLSAICDFVSLINSSHLSSAISPRGNRIVS